MKYVIGILILMFSLHGMAARVKQSVSFDMPSEQTNVHMVPFSAVVPTSFTGHFVRFVHPTNYKSAVARVVKRTGNQFRTNAELAIAIGIKPSVTTVYIEDVL